MDYFELFDIPVSLQVDPITLKRKYHELLGEEDPSAAEEDEAAHAAPSQIKRGYEILQDQDKTIKYVLELKGLMEDDEEYVYDQQFLLDVMEMNDELRELELDEKQEQLMNIEQKTSRLLLKIYEDVAPVVESYKENTTSEEELLQVKDFYYKKKYLQGLLDRIRGIRNIASPL